MNRQPSLSIVLILRNPGETEIDVCKALSADAAKPDIEIIIVDGRPAPSELQPLYEGISVLRAPNLNMPHLKALGAAKCHAKSIAFLEPKAVPSKQWLATILEKIQEHPQDALTGPVHYKGCGTAFDRAAYLFEYGAFTKQHDHSKTTADLAGNNMVLPASSLLTLCADFIEESGLNKPFVQQRLMDGGTPIRFAPNMAIELRTKHSAYDFLKSRFHYARCFGGTRYVEATVRKKWMYRIGTPAIPLLVMVKAFQRASANPLLNMASALWLAGISLIWSTGEAVGYWMGTGKSCERLY